MATRKKRESWQIPDMQASNRTWWAITAHAAAKGITIAEALQEIAILAGI